MAQANLVAHEIPLDFFTSLASHEIRLEFFIEKWLALTCCQVGPRIWRTAACRRYSRATQSPRADACRNQLEARPLSRLDQPGGTWPVDTIAQRPSRLRRVVRRAAQPVLQPRRARRER